MTRRDIKETYPARDERVIGKMHVEDFELGPGESTKVDERVTKYKERVEHSRKVLYKKDFIFNKYFIKLTKGEYS